MMAADWSWCWATMVFDKVISDPFEAEVPTAMLCLLGLQDKYNRYSMHPPSFLNWPWERVATATLSICSLLVIQRNGCEVFLTPVASRISSVYKRVFDGWSSRFASRHESENLSFDRYPSLSSNQFCMSNLLGLFLSRLVSFAQPWLAEVSLRQRDNYRDTKIRQSQSTSTSGLSSIIISPSSHRYLSIYYLSPISVEVLRLLSDVIPSCESVDNLFVPWPAPLELNAHTWHDNTLDMKMAKNKNNGCGYWTK